MRGNFLFRLFESNVKGNIHKSRLKLMVKRIFLKTLVIRTVRKKIVLDNQQETQKYAHEREVNRLTRRDVAKGYYSRSKSWEKMGIRWDMLRFGEFSKMWRRKSFPNKNFWFLYNCQVQKFKCCQNDDIGVIGHMLSEIAFHSVYVATCSRAGKRRELIISQLVSSGVR